MIKNDYKEILGYRPFMVRFLILLLIFFEINFNYVSLEILLIMVLKMYCI